MRADCIGLSLQPIMLINHMASVYAESHYRWPHCPVNIFADFTFGHHLLRHNWSVDHFGGDRKFRFFPTTGRLTAVMVDFASNRKLEKKADHRRAEFETHGLPLDSDDANLVPGPQT